MTTPDPLRAALCLTCGVEAVDPLAGCCGECGAEDSFIGTQWLTLPHNQRPFRAALAADTAPLDAGEDDYADDDQVPEVWYEAGNDFVAAFRDGWRAALAAGHVTTRAEINEALANDPRVAVRLAKERDQG